METHNQSFEEILEESKDIEQNNQHKILNKKLWIAIIIAELILIISWPLIIPSNQMSMATKFQVSIGANLFSFPVLAAILALFIALFPIHGWRFSKKFYRIFLITLCSIEIGWLLAIAIQYFRTIL